MSETDAMMAVQASPIDDQIRCVRREVAMRKQVYAKRCAEGKMNRDVADREIALMEAVLRTIARYKLVRDIPVYDTGLAVCDVDSLGNVSEIVQGDALDMKLDAALADYKEARGADEPRPKCDGNHPMPRCGDPECWQQ